jgi:hypothetical protein
LPENTDAAAFAMAVHAGGLSRRSRPPRC